MIVAIVIVALLVLLGCWAGVLQRRRGGGGVRPEEAGRDRGSGTGYY
jgi:hypothetical protein